MVASLGTLALEPVLLNGQKVEFSSRPWTGEEFAGERRRILQQSWPGGANIDFDEAIAYQQSIPPERRWADVRHRAQREGRSFVTPRLGYGRLEENVRSLQGLVNDAGIGGATIHIDSYTRWFQFDRAARLVEEEYRVGENRLNGYAWAYYGYQRFREILESVPIPIGTVGGGQDGRLWHEFSAAAGVTQGGGSFVPNPFTFTDNKLPLEQALWHGVYGLAMNRWYRERGVQLETGVRGCNSGTARPPSITLALTLVELLTAADQGAANFNAKYYQHGAFLQDIAYLRALGPTCRRYLAQRGHPQADVTVTASHYEGAFPRDPYKAMAVLCFQALTARLGGAPELHSKSLEEGSQIPSHEANLNTCKALRAMFDLLGDYELPADVLAEETEMMEHEVRCLMDNMLDLGQGDILAGFVRAIKTGTMEFPFSPSKHNAGQALMVRDSAGAARFLEVGNLPFDDRVLRFHRSKLANEASLAQADPWDLVLRSIRNVGALRVV